MGKQGGLGGGRVDQGARRVVLGEQPPREEPRQRVGLRQLPRMRMKLRGEAATQP